MHITKDALFMSIVDESLKEQFFERPIEHNFELALFSLPEVYQGGLKRTVQRVKRVFKKYPVRRHLHGPFNDLMYASSDKDIREIAYRKIKLGIEIAGEIGAEHVVFHSTYNPLNPDPRYPEVWLKRSADFWHEMARYARRNDCMIVIENIFDESPEMIKKLIRTLKTPFVKACLDLGHAHIFGKVPITEWVEVLKTDLFHMHIHDNHGMTDEHLGIGAGTIDYKAFFSRLQHLRYVPACTIEVRSEREWKRSLSYIKGLDVWRD